MSITKYIANPPAERTEIVQHEGDTFTLVGRSSGALFAKTMLLSEEEKSKYKAHFLQRLGINVGSDSIDRIAAVQATLVRSEEDGGTEDYNRYDIGEVAQLWDANGPLFFKLYTAAAKALGIITDADIEAARKGKATDGASATEAIEKAASGNSDASAH